MLRKEKFCEADNIITNHCIDIINDFSTKTDYNYITFLNEVRQLISIIRYTSKSSLKRKIVTIFLKSGIIFPMYFYYKLKKAMK